jgi:sensor domain CHASE-containing protein
MTLDPSALSLAVIVLVVAIVVLAVWLAVLQRSEARLRSRLRRILSDNGNAGLDEILAGHDKRIEQLASRVDALNALERELETSSRLALQKVGLVRYNPFQDTGGDQSFAIALLDQSGSGLVISSLHGRAETRIFAKQVANGRSAHSLSDEEQQAIRAAQR